MEWAGLCRRTKELESSYPDTTVYLYHACNIGCGLFNRPACMHGVCRDEKGDRDRKGLLFNG